MKEELVSFECAKIAKEKGFDEECFYSYGQKTGKLLLPWIENGSSTDTEFRVDLEEFLDNHNTKYGVTYSAPTQSLLQRWLREVHGIYVFVKQYEYGAITYQINYKKERVSSYISKTYPSWEEAFEIALLEALHLIQETIELTETTR